MDIMQGNESQENYDAQPTVNRLPAETLCQIFLVVARKRPMSRYPKQRSWFAITQVCQFWRTVSIGYPQLWTSPNFDCDPAFTYLMIQRAKDIPLTVEFSQLRMDEEELSNILHCPGRIRSLKACVDYLLPTWSNLFAKAASLNNLESLILQAVEKDIDPFYVEMNLVDSLNECQSLTHIEIRDFYFSTASFPTPPHLTSLILHTVGDLYNEFLWDPFLDALEISQNLTVLDLKHTIPYFSHSAPRDGRFVRLPHLQHLKIQDHIDKATNLFSSLRTPFSANIGITTPSQWWEEETRDLFDTFRTLGEDSVGQKTPFTEESIDSLLVTSDWDHTTFKLYFPPGRPRNDQRPSCISFSFPCYPDDTWFAADLRQLRGHFNFASLSSMTIEHQHTITMEAWRLLGRLSKHLQLLRLNDTNIEGFIKALAPNGGLTDDSPAFSGLVHLRFQEIEFEREDQSLVTQLCGVLQKRQTSREGYKLEDIKIRTAYRFQDRDYEMLRETVDVRWDEREELSDSDGYDSEDESYEESDDDEEGMAEDERHEETDQEGEALDVEGGSDGSEEDKESHSR